MIRTTSFRLLALVAGMAVAVACDGGKPSGVGTIGGGEPGQGGAGGANRAPVVQIQLPVANANVNIGDSILVGVLLRDASGVRSLNVAGLKITGNPDYGTQVITERYSAVNATFPDGFARTDTVVYRMLTPANPADSLADSLVVRAIATDAEGMVDTAFQVLRLVKGPEIRILAPAPGDSIRPGTQLNVIYAASHRNGVTSVTVRVRSTAGTWPTLVDATVSTDYGQPDVLDTVSFAVPADAPQSTGRLTIEASALASGYQVSAQPPVNIGIRSTVAGAPIVRQTVPSRAERGDSVFIRAIGDNGLVNMGVIAVAGADTSWGTPVAIAGAPAEYQRYVRMELPASMQGKTVSIISYATDAAGLRGYSVSATAITAVDSLKNAWRDLLLVAYGKTYPLPRTGIGGDVAIDRARGRVFVSNAQHNRIEMWTNATATFHADGIRAGAEPWGMTLAANSNDTLLVANSGATNFSRVYIGAADPSAMTERRILTRNTVVYTLSEVREAETGKIRLSLGGPYSYSDRPQYLAQSAMGRIYYSTRPTTAAPMGTIRYLDPLDPVPDSRQVHKYGSRGPMGQWTIFNVDSIYVVPAPAEGLESDLLIICDHPTGTSQVGGCGQSRSGVSATIQALQAAVPTTDIETSDVDIASLGLTDTTFVAWSSDHKWLAFGEGARPQGARVMMVHDTLPDYKQIFFSPGISVADLVENASEEVFGLALDSTGNMLAVHGTDSHFSAVDRSFHLRLQGRYDTPAAGAGIAYHPQANIDPAAPGPDASRLVFVASMDGTIDILDAYYYRSRGRIVVKNALYGPLRASLPFATDPPEVVLKLFGLTPQGMIVIDVTAADIQPVQ